MQKTKFGRGTVREALQRKNYQATGKAWCKKALWLKTAKGKKMNPNPLEKVIEKKVCDHAKQLGCLVYKFTSPSRRSVPDRLFIMPAGKGVFFIEFKRKGCKPTEAQKIEIAKIRGHGIVVGVIDNVTDGKVFVERALTWVDSTMSDPAFN